MKNLSRSLLVLATPFVLLFAGTASADFTVTYTRPNTDFGSYNQFLISPLDMSDMKIVPPAWVTDSKPHKWQLSEKDVEYIRSLYQEYIANGIRSGKKYDVVSEQAPNTLEVDVEIIRLIPWAKKGDKSAKTKGSGEMKFEVVFRDALSGDLLAIGEGLQNVGENYQENVPINHEHNLKEHFFTWGQSLSDALAKQKK